MVTGFDAGSENKHRAPRQRPVWLWWKRAFISLLLLGTLTLLAPQLLRLERMRTLILAQVASALVFDLGLEAQADDFELDLGDGRLVLTWHHSLAARFHATVPARTRGDR